MGRVIGVLMFCLVFCGGMAQKPTPGKGNGGDGPKLVVGIVIDQMRADYLYRFMDKYGEGGFKRLLRQGFEFRNTNYDYVPTYTGPGHAAIYTGTTPYYNGIIGNDWYDRAAGRSVYVTGDDGVSSVGTASAAGKMSPRRLMTTTMTDELRLSNNKQSKVIGVCLKDRGSILPAGHLPTAAYWFDNKSGNWITSTYYAEALPGWVSAFNDKKLGDFYLSKPWNTLYPIAEYTSGLANGSDYRNDYKGEASNQFPHDLPGIKNAIGYELVRSSPFGNSFVTDFAIETLDQEKMGKGAFTDFLAVSYSSTDYVGHQFGINSIEVQDTYARLDRDLERLFAYLDKSVGMDNVLLFLSSDHGAAQTPAQMVALGIPAGIFNSGKLKEQLSEVLVKSYGAGNWVLAYDNEQVYLNNALILEKGLKREEVLGRCLDYLRLMEGVQEVFSLSGGDSGAKGVHSERLFNGVSPSRSGDIAVVLQPGWFPGGYGSKGTAHGSGYSYDTHVPLVFMGWKIKQGSSGMAVNVTDIAATVCDLLRISFTNGNVGRPLGDLMRR